MAVPKNRHTKSRRNKRRSHIKLSPAPHGICEKCGVRTPPHFLCENCGSYKGREMVDVLKKRTKKERREVATNG
ncbi:MAG: 50S ribosomal protein L32 [Candidatus Spechtbacteria bacterium SB0662_bin_43]|uniref:Large ribosomal subunit protein bL32 n=1 Tax=Candidatus Spechtbacteria bacterium SB0662_bin_43 TaxID=2604897 RepID=A0A845D8M0_9BACT|nr:50S ribosomal protein L32 [Candidatus Spechtbacteria bacterium SB0662_bin_43]